MNVRIIFLLLSIVTVFPVFSKTIKERFYDNLMAQRYNAADSLLKVWQAENPDDAELIAARFNYYLNKSRQEMIVLTSDTTATTGYTFADSTGTKAGAITSEVCWDNDLFDDAVNEIESGIKRFPRRLDFRFGLAKAFEMRDLYDREADVLVKVLDECRKPGTEWLWIENIAIPSEDLIRDSMFDYFTVLFRNNADKQLQSLCRKYLEVFNDDIRVLNILGGSLFATSQLHEALEAFEKARTLAPDDGLIICNIGTMYTLCGKKDKAKEVYHAIIDNPRCDAESQQIAKEALQALDKPLRRISPYELAHQWLSVVVADITPEQGEILASPYYLNHIMLNDDGMESPFTYDQISVEKIVDGDKAVYVWRFPEPQNDRDALYIAFFEVGNGYRAYAICKGKHVDWEISTSNKKTRQTYGDVDRPESAAQCVEILKSRGAYTGKITPSKFFK